MNNTQEGRDTVSMPNIHSLDLHGVSASPSVVVAPSDVQGTIAATLRQDQGWYRDSSHWLIRGTLFPERARAPARPLPPRFRAKDLVDELGSINAQIHKIMSQVEKAVARLATSG